MRTFLILLFAIVVIEAGTRRANPGEEQKALALWKKFCSDQKDGGQEGNIFIHCKHPLQPERHTLHTSVTGNSGGGEQREQYIFVQPPTLHFNHDISVLGGAALEPKTIVYVKPGQSSHKYEANLRISEADHKKPELVFLTSGGNDEGSDRVPTPVETIDPVPQPGIAKQISKRQTDAEPVKITEPVTQRHSVMKNLFSNFFQNFLPNLSRKFTEVLEDFGRRVSIQQV